MAQKADRKRGYISFGLVILIALIIGIFFEECEDRFVDRPCAGTVRLQPVKKVSSYAKEKTLSNK